MQLVALLRWMVLLLLVAACSAMAHELPDNRLTVVRREPHHLSLTFYVDQAELLRRVIAPRSHPTEFALASAAMSAEEFASRVRGARALLEAGTRLTTSEGGALGPLVWRWPAPAMLQAALQQRAMRSIVAPADHRHEPPDEIHAELTSPVVISRVRLSASTEWQPLLVVWYQPQQAWMRPGSAPVELQY